jgi:amidase
MASSARSLALYAQVLLQDEPWFTEPSVLPMPWQPSIIDAYDKSRKISVAILWCISKYPHVFLEFEYLICERDDGVVAPHPPIYDALRRFQQALIVSGHEVIDWEPLDHQKALDIVVNVLSHFFLPDIVH